MRKSVRGAAMVAACAMLVSLPVAAGSPGPGPSASAPLAPSPAASLPLPGDVVPGGPSMPLADASADVRAAYAGAGLLDYGPTCTAALIRPPGAGVPATTPAYVLTNGHCVDIFDGTTVLRDIPVEAGRGEVAFGARPDGTPEHQVPLSSIRWASMKGTDLAILELDTTLQGLLAAGVPAYPVGAPVAEGATVVVVGGPAPIDAGGRALRLGACTMGRSVDLYEWRWAWFDFPANDCADVRPGSSGSPVFDPATGRMVGLISTTTRDSAGVPDCALGRPCEMRPGGPVSREHTSYGPALGILAGCFDRDGVFTGPGASCALDAGDGMGVDGWTTTANPGAPGAPASWAVQLRPATPEQTWVRVAEGPAGAIDCHDPSAYGQPIPVPDDLLLDPPLPTTDGSHLLCLLGGTGPEATASWQAPAFPTVLRMEVDRVPPTGEIELSVRETPEGWLVEPIYRPPDLSWFDWKWGPPQTTDCGDPVGYAPYRRIPEMLLREDAPIRLCVVGYDDAQNASAPVDRIFGAP